MPPKSLEVVLGHRHRAVELARRELAACFAAASAAQARERAAAHAIAREGLEAVAIGAGDGQVEAFARWLPGARRLLEQAGRDREAAESAVVVAQAGLTVARTAEAAVAELVAKRQVEATARAVAVDRSATEDQIARSPSTNPLWLDADGEAGERR